MQMFTSPLFQIKLRLLFYSIDLKAPRELWNPQSNAVPGKFHWFAGISKSNFL